MDAQWYAIRVRVRSEQTVARSLAAKEVECFLPSWEERRAYSDRIQRVAVAAFPGYLFCRIDRNERLRVLSTPGAQSLAGAGNLPQPISEQVISSLQQAFSRSQRVSSVPYLMTGDTVRVLEGPMAGAVGVLDKTKGRSRLVISVHVLERSVAVEVDGASVMLLTRPPLKDSLEALRAC